MYGTVSRAETLARQLHAANHRTRTAAHRAHRSRGAAHPLYGQSTRLLEAPRHYPGTRLNSSLIDGTIFYSLGKRETETLFGS